MSSHMLINSYYKKCNMEAHIDENNLTCFVYMWFSCMKTHFQYKTEEKQ